MTQPLALVAYEKLLPGTQLVNRLQDMKYRVHAVMGVDGLVACAQEEKPMLVLVDLTSAVADVCEAIRRLRRAAGTEHIPVIAFAPETAADLQAAAREAGAALVVSESAILSHLSQFLQQALQV